MLRVITSRVFSNIACQRNCVILCIFTVFVVLLFTYFINSSITIQKSVDSSLKWSSSLPKKITKTSAKIDFPVVQEYVLRRGVRKYDNEEARIIGFKKKAHFPFHSNQSTKIIYLATTYFNEWNPRHYYSLRFGNESFQRYSCPVSNCFVTNDPEVVAKSDAIIAHVRDLQVFSVPKDRRPNQVWILYSMEPPWLEIKDLQRFDGVFNWTMSYRRNSDFEIKYGFVGKRSKLSDVRPFISSSTKQNRAVWLVSNCRTDSNREGYVELLKKVYPVDVFGGCGIEACRPSETRKCYRKLASRYKFYLSFENALCRDYVTEKLYNALEYDMVPVVLGGADYSKLTPEGSIINAKDFKNPEDLGNFLWEVSRNESKYLSYFSWKAWHRSYLQPWTCELCEKLNRPIERKSRVNLEAWWHEGHSCSRWTKNGFEKVERYAFPEYNSKIFA